MTIEHERRETAREDDSARLDEGDQMVDRDRDVDADTGESVTPDLDADARDSTARHAQIPDDEAQGVVADDDTEVDDRDMADVVADTYDTDATQSAAPAESATPGETGEVRDRGPLLPAGELDRIRNRWHELQHGFVDDPRHAADDAAELVSLAADRVMSMLRDEVASLEGHRPGGLAGDGEPDTEELRTLMRRYHELLDRLLAV